jgi:hypothetical protein
LFSSVKIKRQCKEPFLTCPVKSYFALADARDSAAIGTIQFEFVLSTLTKLSLFIGKRSE